LVEGRKGEERRGVSYPMGGGYLVHKERETRAIRAVIHKAGVLALLMLCCAELLSGLRPALAAPAALAPEVCDGGTTSVELATPKAAASDAVAFARWLSGRHEVSSLGRTVIVPVQASSPAESATETATLAPAMRGTLCHVM